MPKISEFGGISIYLYYNDHDPPHFHVIYSELRTRIEIMTGEYLREDKPLPRTKEKDVIMWLDIHKGDMIKAWYECRCKEAPRKIPPLY
ncbi:DUF4160 domain-containing protein [Rossellomorea vietnamensis]|uniref:DUF4160 domain-containing protein n=1 Tax=Rossellomorea vietnamensis TaxID=218284 RepID=A0A0P6VW48_9BACI|nr:DUF4160 domain-containing protein [Rossellomorea vietnamensis]KPL59208.1 hypothetical protein AM506_11795 [Rossellomorea vietnamensis]